ncbi:MAG: hypothetical protein E7176_06575 [Erysipelotrichaceae bacterium]|nr:hypothetical protein [Erysipelotrichaceae bacterium]
MKEIKIKDNYTYIEYDSDALMFYYLDKYLKAGYIITDSIFLCVELSKNNNFILLSYTSILNPDEHIKDKIRELEKSYELSYPNYNDTLLNVISAIRANYGYSHKYSPNPNVFDRKYGKVIILILDGMGEVILNRNFKEDSFIRSHYAFSVSSIYPSTTAAATTSIKSGLSPIESGWTGWENYIREINRNVILFTGVNYFNDEPTGILPFKYIPYNMFYKDMDIKGYCIEPDFSKPKHDINDVLKESIRINKLNEKQVQYVYYTEPDSIMHEFGADSQSAIDICSELDKKVEEYASKLSSDTLLIISADHGHLNVKEIAFYACKPILDLLNRRPSNDSRCITFSVKKNKHKEFEKIFNALFSSVYKLYKASDAISLGFFGASDDIINPRCDDFLGDYVAVAISNYYLNYKGEDSFSFKSHHAGITADEMRVPICLVRR